MSMTDERIDIQEWMSMSPEQVGELFAAERQGDPEIDRFAGLLVKTLTGDPDSKRLRELRVEFEALTPLARLAVWSELTSNQHPIEMVMMAHSHLVYGVLSCFKGLDRYEKSA